jgi:hypothetical protein
MKEEFDFISRVVQSELAEALESGDQRVLIINVSDGKLDELLVRNEHGQELAKVRAFIALENT